MSNLLSGISSLAYQGTNAASPPNFRVQKRDPISTDWQNFSLGDLWLNDLNQNVWILVSLAGNVAVWQLLAAGGGNTETLTGNSGGAITPLASNINVLGDGITINVAGNPATHTLTISAIGTGVDESLTGNSGGAVFPTAGNINVRGDGTTITVAGNPGTSTLTISAVGSGLVDTLTGNTGGPISPLAGNINVVGDGTTITIAGSGHTLTASIVGPVSIANGGTNATSMTNIDGVVYYDGTRLVTTAVGTAGQILTSNGVGVAPTYQTASGTSITITGDSGGALTSGSFTFTGGATGLTFVGSGTTETLGGALVVSHGGTGASTLTGILVGNGTSAITGNPITQHDVLVGGAANAITSVAPTVTSGTPLISQGASSDPIFGTAVVAGGGTGATSFNVDGVVISNTTTTGALAALTLTNGQVVIGSTGNPPAAATLTAGTGISITNAANSITIAVSGSSVSSILGTGGAPTNQLSVAGSTSWDAPFGVQTQTTQANPQLAVPITGAISRLYVYVSANTSTTNVTVTLNVNSVNSALVTTVTALTTGSFSDLTHTVNVTAGDLIQFEIQASTVGAISGNISCVFTA